MARWFVAAACALALACGDGGSKDDGAPPDDTGGTPDDGGGTPDDGQGPSCVPSTCVVLGATCGTLADGCGGALSCGDCAAGESCGAGGRPNVCATVASCRPVTCASLGKDCGPMPDGCGGVLECGACTGGELCGAGGAANVCAAPPVNCVPETCAALGKNCGAVADGCGGELTCGTCAAGQACGAGGTPNVCAAPPPEPEVRWFARLGGPGDELVNGVAVDDGGRRAVLSTRPDASTWQRQEVVLRWYDAAGKAAGEKRWEGPGYLQMRLWGAANGDLLLYVYNYCGDCPQLDLGGGPLPAGESLVALDREGAFRWQVPVVEGLASVAAAPDGGALLATHWGGVRRYAPDGALVWSVAGDGRACAVDRRGDAVCASSLLPWDRPSLTRVQKLAARDGAVVWTRDVTGVTPAFSQATSDQGTFAFLGWRTGEVDVGPEPVREGGMALVVLEADGRPRWAKGLESLNYATLTVDPTGRVAAIGAQGACGAIVAHAWRLGGERLWTRTIPTDGACWTGVNLGSAAYGSDHLLTLGGWFWGALRLGDERLRPEGHDGLVVTLSP